MSQADELVLSLKYLRIKSFCEFFSINIDIININNNNNINIFSVDISNSFPVFDILQFYVKYFAN